MGATVIDSALREARARLGKRGWPALVSGCAAVALVVDPARWLAETWRDPAYQSDGVFVALAIGGLLVASVASGPAQPDRRAAGIAWRLLLGTAAARVVGHLLAVNTIGALALVVDVAAVAIALGVDRRPLALRPAALAAFSVLALPIEHLLQRLLGHPLQLAAAGLSEWLVSPFDPAVVREGVLLVHPEVALAVDLPCSGARGLMLFTGLALACWCRREATPGRAALVAVAVAVGALASNALRVVVLYAGARLGTPLQDEPWHSAIGCAVLVVGALPVLFTALPTPARHARFQRPFGVQLGTRRRAGLEILPEPVVAVLLLVAAWAVLFTPEEPLDASLPLAPRPLPEVLGGRLGETLPTSELERLYFERYGGSVSKRAYAGHTAMVVRTASPLRHLHGPDRCLIGAGHRVTRLGVRHGRVPTVVYRSVAPDGRAYRIEASYVDDRGRSAASVSQVLWRWLDEPGAWSLVERITPWSLCARDPARCAAFDADLFAALDLPSPVSRLADRFPPPRTNPMENPS